MEKYKHLIDAYVASIKFEEAYAEQHELGIWEIKELSSLIEERIFAELIHDLEGRDFEIIGKNLSEDRSLDKLYIDFDVYCSCYGRHKEEDIRKIIGTEEIRINDIVYTETDETDAGAVYTVFTASVSCCL